MILRPMGRKRQSFKPIGDGYFECGSCGKFLPPAKRSGRNCVECNAANERKNYHKRKPK